MTALRRVAFYSDIWGILGLKRVVVTGMSAVTSIGDTWQSVLQSLKAGVSGIRYMDEWHDIQGLGCFLAAPVSTNVGSDVPRKNARGMSRVSMIAAQTAKEALHMSDLELSGFNREKMGIAYGSSFGSAEQLVPFGRVLSERKVRGISPTGYIKLMGHTAAVNLSLLLGAKGRLIPTSSACASGGQAIGYAFETIRQGIHPVMVAGSAEELSPAQVAVFDSFFSASREHDIPDSAAKPFACDRSGMVVGEGGATFILEELEHAKKRGAKIIAEVVGFDTNMDGSHIIKQDPEMMKKVIEGALHSSRINKHQIGYVNAHASGAGSDSVEALVMRDIFGDQVPVGSSKGHIGHALGGCGSIESWLTINMMNQEWFAPTLNLDRPDTECSGLYHIGKGGLEMSCDYVMNNNFAFGGVNVSVIFKRWKD